MSEETNEQRDELELEELEAQNGEPLPDREAMSIVAFDPGPMPLEPPE